MITKTTETFRLFYRSVMPLIAEAEIETVFDVVAAEMESTALITLGTSQVLCLCSFQSPELLPSNRLTLKKSW